MDSIDEQTMTIKQAYKNAIATHHPDKPGESFTGHFLGHLNKES